MIEKELLRGLIKKCFSEGTDDQINALLEDLTRELEIITHARICEQAGFEESKGYLYNC